MSINLSQFHQVFFEESFEGLDVMESSLMELDPNNIDDETINAIFRAAHSIKGGSATFGFTSISEFTHELETLLDQVRAGKRGLNSDEVNLLLQSVDCMREMIELHQAGEDGRTSISNELTQKISSLLSDNDPSAADTSIIANPNATCKWIIKFSPSKDILKNGNEPIRLIRELDSLGKLSLVSVDDRIPNLADIELEDCYLAWEFSLISDCERETIFAVFEWVADESDIDISAQIDADPVEGDAHDTQGWLIDFHPKEGILQTGNDVVKMLSALAGLGQIHVNVDTANLPNLTSMKPENCYLMWRVRLNGDEIEKRQIEEVFEWVDDQAKIHITPLGDSAQEVNEAVSPVDETISPLKEVNVSSSKKAPVKKASAAETTSIRVGIDKIDSLINMVGELVITQSMLGQLGSDFNIEKIPQLLEGLSQLEQNTRELQENVMRIRMLPISFVFSRFPRLVRDLSQSLDKKIDFEMQGENTELDKTVMEKIGDPLTHIVRNAVDHGVETPEERINAGKSEVGRIELNAYHQGGNVVIEVHDDGKGIDHERIRQKAIDKGLISNADAELLTREQCYDLIFHPGLSTAKTVTDVSGRGVGMDVVKKNIQALNGVVEIDSNLNRGSTFTIRLPLTLAILDGQLVRVGTHTYIFPIVSIVESIQCRDEMISKVAGGCKVIKLRDEYVPILDLADLFNIEREDDEIENSLMVIVESEGVKVGIKVDELLAQQQVVIKSLEQNYQRVNGISGATILGDGTVALILDLAGIVQLGGHNYKSLQAAMSPALNVESNVNSLALRH